MKNFLNIIFFLILLVGTWALYKIYYPQYLFSRQTILQEMGFNYADCSFIPAGFMHGSKEFDCVTAPVSVVDQKAQYEKLDALIRKGGWSQTSKTVGQFFDARYQKGNQQLVIETYWGGGNPTLVILFP